jgi:hypothetical protein
MACWVCGKFAAVRQIATACPQLGEFPRRIYLIEIVSNFAPVLFLTSYNAIFFPIGSPNSDNWYRTWMDFNP